MSTFERVYIGKSWNFPQVRGGCDETAKTGVKQVFGLPTRARALTR